MAKVFLQTSDPKLRFLKPMPMKKKAIKETAVGKSELYDRALHLLEENHLSRTQSRVEILKVFLAKGCLVSADDVYSVVRKFDYDLTTVYRTLQTFEESSIVSRVQLADGEDE